MIKSRQRVSFRNWEMFIHCILNAHIKNAERIKSLLCNNSHLILRNYYPYELFLYIRSAAKLHP